MRMTRRCFGTFLLAGAGLCAGALLPLRGQQENGKTPKIDFVHDIAPIIKARCAECHTNGKYKGSLSLETRQSLLKAKVVVPGSGAASELVKRITSTDLDERMPPKGKSLSAKEVALIKAWIDQGLPWEPGFSFKTNNYVAPLKPRGLVLPPARAGLEHPIDRILDGYFAKHPVATPGPGPSPAANAPGSPIRGSVDDATFIRRVFLDVIGLLPTPAEVDAFAGDTAPDRRVKLAQRVLADRRGYAEHWLTFWNDLLRNDYAGTGYIDGGRKQISAWLYRSLLDNKPYDQFVRELLSPTAESEGFVLGIKWRGNVNASQVREVQFSQNVSLVFFGVNMKCASCHDSFIDSWKLDDAYGLAAVIADSPLEIHRCDKKTGKIATPRFLWPELGPIDAKLPKARRLEQVARLVTHPANGRFTRTLANRMWQRLMGRGLVQPVDIMANRPWNEDLLDYLAVYLSDNGYDVKKLIEHIITSKIYQSRTAVAAQEAPGEQYVFRGPEVKRMTAEQFIDSIWQITGTAPAKADAPVTLPRFDGTTPKERQFIRAALVRSDLLMRSLGRPNREQVVTTRPDVLTTLQALDLSNGQILTDLLLRGAVNVRKAHPKDAPEQLIEALFRESLCRRATSAELTAARQVVGAAPTTESIADLLWCIVMLPEYQLIR
jgi:hypothetical protein